MENNRPRGREKHVTGPAKTVKKRGEGLSTGPVGDAGGYQDRKPEASSGQRSAGTRSGGGMMKLVLLALLVLLGGGGGLTAMLGGQPDAPSSVQTPSAGQQQVSNAGSGDWGQVLGGLGGGSVSSGWQSTPNTGKLDASVAPGARERYTALLGNGRDTITIMVYMCGTDLESRSKMGTMDLQEMLNASFGNDVNLLVYTGGCKGWQNTVVSSTTNQIWQIKDGRMACLEKDLGSVPMTDPDVLSGYIRWCAENYPASRYELILWDHGGGSVSGYGYDEKFASGGSDSPLPALLGMLGGAGSGGDDISALLASVLGGRSLDMENANEYLTAHRFPDEALVWQTGEDGVPVLRLNEQQWGLVQDLELNLFYDDGEGYIDLGLDNTFDFDGEGGLLGVNEGTWLAVEGQPVAYYHTATVDDGTSYAITGRVPVLHNGSRAELILTFDTERPQGYVAGVQTVYLNGETDTVAKSQSELQPGDTLEFLCDYYSYDGDYQDSYLLGDPLIVTEEELTVGDVPLDGVTRASYRFTDIFGKHHWTPTLQS